MIKAFAPFGVNKDHIEQRIGKKLDAVLSEDIVQLTTIYQSLKDNMSKPSDWFGTTEQQAPEAIADLNTAVGSGPKPAATRPRKPIAPPETPSTSPSETSSKDAPAEVQPEAETDEGLI